MVVFHRIELNLQFYFGSIVGDVVGDLEQWNVIVVVVVDVGVRFVVRLGFVDITGAFKP